MKTTHKIDDTVNNGIHKIECTNFNRCLIGQAKKPLKERYLEHLNAFNLINQFSVFTLFLFVLCL